MFSKIKISLLCVCIFTCLSGCQLLGDPLEKAAGAGGKLVKYYCANVTIPEVREKIRERVNYHAAPDSVAVTCAKGGPVLNSDTPPSE